MDSCMEPDNSQQMDYKKQYTCAVASKQVSACATSLKLDNCEGDDGWRLHLNSFMVYSHQFNEP